MLALVRSWCGRFGRGPIPGRRWSSAAILVARRRARESPPRRKGRSAGRSPKTWAAFPTQLAIPGQTMLVPAGFPRKWVPYVTRPGDTVGDLAAARGTTVSAIVQVNDLRDSTEIKVGQQLLLPPPIR